MPFQSFLDPFAYALQAEGSRLQNDGQALNNAIKLDELNMARLKFDAVKQDMIEAGKAAQATRPVTSPMAPGGLQDANRGGAQGAGDPEYQPPPSLAMFSNAKALEDVVTRLRRTGADPSKVATAQQEYNNSYKGAVEQQNKEFNEQAPFLEKVSDALFRMAQDPATGGAELARLRREQPPGMNLDALLYGDDTKGQGFGLKRGMGGVPIPDKQKLLQASTNSKLVKEAADRHHKEQQEANEQRRLKLAEERENDSKRRISDLESRMRDGEDHKKALEETKKKQADDGLVERERKSLHATPVYKNWDEYQLGVSKAMGIAQQIKEKGYAAFSTSDASMLVSAMRDQQNRYRARLGGTSKSEDQQMDHLNGVIRGFEKWITTIGEGDKKLAFDTLGEATRSMYNVGMLRNEQVVRESLKHVQTLANNKLANRASDLEAEGDIDSLIQQGWVKPVRDGNKKFYVMRSQMPNAKGEYEMKDKYYVGDVEEGK